MGSGRISNSLRPRLRPLEISPYGPEKDLLFALSDPEGFGDTVLAPYGALLLGALMDGQNTLARIQAAYRDQTGIAVPLVEVQQLVAQLDQARLLEGERYESYRRRQIEEYVNSPVRPAVHAGQAYSDDPDELCQELAGYFTCENGPGEVDLNAKPGSRPLRGVISPHIDPHRGGPLFAWAYKKLAEESDADLFVIFGTAHSPMQEWFCVSPKDFDTPLGVVQSDGRFIYRLAEHLGSSLAGQQIDLFKDELAQRREHSIEFQVTLLQYVLGGRRQFRIVPVLTNSFQELMADKEHPDDSPEVEAFIAAMRTAVAEYPGRVCFISGADLAHVGQRYGDEWLLSDQRLSAQSADDCKLLEATCRCDPAAAFKHVADQDDRGRICGLSPIYTMLRVAEPLEGELLRYDQAVEPDGTSCVSFAAVAFYDQS